MVNGIPKIIGRSQAGTTPASRKLARVDVCAIGTPGLRAFRVCRGKGTQDTNKHCGHSTLRHGPCNGRICEPDADFGDLQLGKSDGSATGRPALLDNQAKLLSCCGPGSMTNSKDFREEKKTLGIKCWCIADGWWDNIPLAGRDFPPVACFDSGGSWDARWCACAVAHAAVWRKSDLWRSMDGWKENWGWWAWEGFSVFGGTPTKTGERVCKMTHDRVMYRHITQGWTLVWRLFLAQKEVSVRLTLLIDLQCKQFGLLWVDFLSAEVAYKFTIVLDCMSRLATPASPGLDVANCWPAVYKRKDGKQCNRATEQYTQWNLIGILKSESIVFSCFQCLLL